MLLQDARPPQKGPTGRGQKMKDCCVFDLTLPANKNGKKQTEIVFRKLCKKYTFQLEKGEKTGYEHFQCRVSFFKKKTFSAAKSMLYEAGLQFNPKAMSPSSTNSLKGEAFYCMKEDTRLEGPWTDQDEKPIPKTITVKRMDHNGLLPWQGDLLDQVLDDSFKPIWDDRHIHVVYDPKGDIGKTAFVEYVHSYRYGCVIPPMFVMEDIVQFAMCRPESRLYVIDLPRAMDKRNLASMFAGIEVLKSGQMYDKRYKGVFKWIERPNIIVFTNVIPDSRYLSLDRWRIWSVYQNKLIKGTLASIYVGENSGVA